MSDPGRLRFLQETGRAAIDGVKSLLTGGDVIIDPNEPESSPSEGPEAIGSAIGRKALAAAEHRSGLASRQGEGQAISVDVLSGETPPSLAVYASDGAVLVQQALGLTGEPLPCDGDLGASAATWDLAWLPLLTGWTLYRRMQAGRLLAVGGYRQAALVQFGIARPRAPVWCGLSNDHLYALLPPARRSTLYLEEPGRLWAAIQSGRVAYALMGGRDLERALEVPEAMVAERLQGPVGLDWLPVWGLFGGERGMQSAKADDEGAMVADRHLLLLRAEQCPELDAWLDEVIPS